jgi:hypothetical protein
MRGPKPKYRITLTPEEEQSLRRLVRARNSPQGKVVRARILVLAEYVIRLRVSACAAAPETDSWSHLLDT